MGVDIIPYDPYHPHLVYTLTISWLAGLTFILYSRRYLDRRPHQRNYLFAFAIGLPVYAELVNYLIYRLRPGPSTRVGYLLAHFHAHVLQKIPIDSFLSATKRIELLALLGGLLLVSLLRSYYGLIRLRRLLAVTQELDLSSYTQAMPGLSQLVARSKKSLPPIHVINWHVPLAFTTGAFHPRIYIDSELLELLTADEIVAVVCHEWAHVRRRDNLWNWLLHLLHGTLYFIPSSHMGWQAIIESQDEACDLAAIELTQQPLVLARALVKVAGAWQYREPRSDISLVAVPFAMTTTTITVDRRVTQILRSSDREMPGSARRATLGTVLLSIALLILATLPALLGS